MANWVTVKSSSAFSCGSNNYNFVIQKDADTETPEKITIRFGVESDNFIYAGGGTLAVNSLEAWVDGTQYLINAQDANNLGSAYSSNSCTLYKRCTSSWFRLSKQQLHYSLLREGNTAAHTLRVEYDAFNITGLVAESPTIQIAVKDLGTNRFKIDASGVSAGVNNPITNWVIYWHINNDTSNNGQQSGCISDTGSYIGNREIRFRPKSLEDTASLKVVLGVYTTYNPGDEYCGYYTQSQTINVKQIVAPTGPTNLKIESVGLEYGSGRFVDKLKFSWDASSAQNNNSPVTGYDIYIGSSNSYGLFSLGVKYNSDNSLAIIEKYEIIDSENILNDRITLGTSIKEIFLDTKSFSDLVRPWPGEEIIFNIQATSKNTAYSNSVSSAFKLSGASVPGPLWVKKDGEWQEGNAYVKTSDADDPWKAGAVFVKTADGWKGIY